jgi:phosphoenolpyruvate carboxylase
MTTAARELERVRQYYGRFVAGSASARILPDDDTLERVFGRFSPDEIHVIPLLEDRPRLESADTVVRDYLSETRGTAQRVFIARSDPALNYGMTSAVLLALIALDRLHRLEREVGIPIYPILGAGGAPFRGNLRPPTVRRVLATYPSVQTFTIQSAFKYDYPMDDVKSAVEALRTAPRRDATPLADDPHAQAIVEKSTNAYRASVSRVAPLVTSIARHIPRRRMRKLHVGLFGYSRSSGGISLPRAIPFCATLYSIGLPPEILGIASLDGDDWQWLRDHVPGFEDDLRDAAVFLDPESANDLPEPVRADIHAAARLVDDVDREHQHVTRSMRRSLDGSPEAMSELIVRAAARRHFLG